MASDVPARQANRGLTGRATEAQDRVPWIRQPQAQNPTGFDSRMPFLRAAQAKCPPRRPSAERKPASWGLGNKGHSRAASRIWRAPIFPQLREYKRLGNRTVSIIGFRTRDLVFWEQ